MFNKAALLQILIDELALELECQALECTHGVGGARWKTPALEAQYALQISNIHIAGAHGQQDGGDGGAAQHGGGGKVQISLPVVGESCSPEDLKYFTRSWNQYVRASNETDDVKLRDQLQYCPDETLKKALDRALGDRVDSISVVDLLEEIETLAVVRQSNHVNTLALMTSKQERDEPVRQFAARLHGLASVCDLTVTSTCLLKVS